MKTVFIIACTLLGVVVLYTVARYSYKYGQINAYESVIQYMNQTGQLEKPHEAPDNSI